MIFPNAGGGNYPAHIPGHLLDKAPPRIGQERGPHCQEMRCAAYDTSMNTGRALQIIWAVVIAAAILALVGWQIAWWAEPHGFSAVEWNGLIGWQTGWWLPGSNREILPNYREILPNETSRPGEVDTITRAGLRFQLTTTGANYTG